MTSLLPNLGTPENFTKICMHVKNRFDQALENALPTFEAVNLSITTKYNASFYAKNDKWMIDILEAKNTVSRSLVENALCFERIKDMCMEKQLNENLSLQATASSGKN